VQERSPSFDFTAWLLAALQRGWLAGATTTTTAP
jgi:hypothetical protein